MKHYTKDGKQIEIAGHIVKPDEAPQAYEILKGIDNDIRRFTESE